MKDNKQERVARYLSAGNRDMVFGELSDSFLRNMGGYEILKGIPVPITETENGQIPVRGIFVDMAKVIGGDSAFVYAEQYLTYMKAVAGDDAEAILVSEGAKAADEGKFEDACKLLRTALLIDPKSQAALYLYARACKACYETEDMDEDYVGTFKAESMESFELLTMMHPEFAMGYYFLGYAYLNLGLYTKAKLTWEDFMKYSSSAGEEGASGAGMDDNELDDLRHEISDMLQDLDDPVRIEMGCNQIMAGDFVGGRDTLSEFKEGKYENWWPLWYYLGIAEASLGNAQEAIADYKKVLTLSPSNIDVMEDLVQLYEAIGDFAGASKYRNKIGIVKSNIEAESLES